MIPDPILESILSALLSFLAGLVLYLLPKLFARHWGQQAKPTKSYSERLTDLTTSLTKASGEVDFILRELAEVSREREAAVRKLETDLSSMEVKERELKDRIEVLQKTPIPVADHFAKLLEQGERRSTRRDYLLFGLGVVITTIIAVVMQYLGR